MNFLNIDFSWQDVITILSFIASIVALKVAWIAYQLQKKSDKDLNRIEDSINQMEHNIKQIDKVIFEIEKNRLASYLPKENQKDIHKIFYESQYKFREKNDKDDNCLGGFTVRFIRENNGLPKMAYPFSRTGDFPYFCVYVIKTSSNYRGEIQTDKYYYLSYDFKSWYMAEKYPIEGCSYTHKGFKVTFSGTGFSGKGLPPVSEFCKNC